jgi:hypothetical protein
MSFTAQVFACFGIWIGLSVLVVIAWARAGKRW